MAKLPPIDINELAPIDIADLEGVDPKTVPGSTANRAALRLTASGDGAIGSDGKFHSTRTPTEEPSIVGSIARGVGDMVTGPMHYGADVAKRAGLVPEPDDGFVRRITRNLPPVASLRTGYEMGKDVVHSATERGKKIADPKRSLTKKAGDVLALAGAVPSYGATLGVADMSDNIENAEDPVRAFTTAAAVGALSTKPGQQAAQAGTRKVAGTVVDAIQSPYAQKIGRRGVNSYIGKNSVGLFGQNGGRGVGREGIIAFTDEGFAKKIDKAIKRNQADKQMLLESPAVQSVELDMRAPVKELLEEGKTITTRSSPEASAAWDRFVEETIADLGESTNGTFRMSPIEADAFKWRIGAKFEKTFSQADESLKALGQRLYSNVDRTITEAVPNYGNIDQHLADLHKASEGMQEALMGNEWRRGVVENPATLIPGRNPMQKDIGTRQGLEPLFMRTGLASLTHPPVPASIAPLMQFGRAALGTGEAADQWSMNVTTGEKPTPAPILPQSTPQIGPITGPEYIPGTMVNPQLSRRALPPADGFYGDPPGFMSVGGEMLPETPPPAPGGAMGPFAVHPDGVAVPEGYQYRTGFRTEPSVASPFEAGFKQEPSIVPGRNLQESQAAPAGGRPTADTAAAAEARARNRERTIAQSSRAVKERRADATFTAGGDKAVTARKEGVANAVSRRNYKRASDVAASENVSTDPIVNSVAPREMVKETATTTSTTSPKSKSTVPERPAAVAKSTAGTAEARLADVEKRMYDAFERADNAKTQPTTQGKDTVVPTRGTTAVTESTGKIAPQEVKTTARRRNSRGEVMEDLTDFDEVRKADSAKMYEVGADHPIESDAREADARPAAPPASKESDYVYHATDRNVLADIEKGGLKTFGPSYGTPDQSMWPDGVREKRNYFSGNRKTIDSFAKVDNPKDAVALRVRKDAGHEFKRERGTGDLYSNKPVKADMIEVEVAPDQWVPLKTYMKSQQSENAAGVDSATSRVRTTVQETKKKEAAVRTRDEHTVVPDRRSTGTDSAPETWRDGETITDTTTGKTGKFKRVIEFGFGPETRTFIKLDDGTMVPLANARRGIINSGK